jgi:hypothetical protein
MTSSFTCSADESDIFPRSVRFVKFKPPVGRVVLVEFCPAIEPIPKTIRVASNNMETTTRDALFTWDIIMKLVDAIFDI